MGKIVILDNYDSFTYNLYHLVKELSTDEIQVIRNDKLSIEEVETFDKIIFSPGPGIPQEAGLMLDIIKRYAPYKSMLGVCLGHQAIGETFGATLTNLEHVFHGIQSDIRILENKFLFNGLNEHLLVGRYHSWIVDKKNFPEELIITAESSEGQVMAIRHKEYNVHGIQFHPESVLTPLGKNIIDNFLKL